MKKLLACATLAVAFNAGACGTGNFHNGWYLGGSAGTVGLSGSQSVAGTTSTGYNVSSWAPVVTIDGKYAMSCDSLYRAFDARLGWIFGSKSKSDQTNGKATLKQGFMAGVGFRLGTFLSDSTVVFARAGLNANAQKFSYQFNGARKSDRFMEYTFEPGAGIEWAIGEGKTFEILYGYGMNFSTRGEKTSEHSYSKGPNAQHITVGYSVAL